MHAHDDLFSQKISTFEGMTIAAYTTETYADLLFK